MDGVRDVETEFEMGKLGGHGGDAQPFEVDVPRFGACLETGKERDVFSFGLGSMLGVREFANSNFADVVRRIRGVEVGGRVVWRRSDSSLRQWDRRLC